MSMFQDEQSQLAAKLVEFSRQNDLPQVSYQWLPIPFSGKWGLSTSFFQLASQEMKEKGIDYSKIEEVRKFAHFSVMRLSKDK